MNRRAFVTGLGAVLTAPLVVEAQEAGRVWRLGFISVTHTKVEDVLFEQLRQLGYVEGRNLVVERRYSEGRAERFAEFAAALVRLKPDLIIVTTTPAALAAKKATKTIPIVQANSIDPVVVGLAASLARPGGNFTGSTQLAPDTIAKRLQLLAETIPRLSTVAIIWNAANPANARSWSEAREAARVLGVSVHSREVRDPSDFERVFTAMTHERPDALLFISDQLTLQHSKQVVDFAVQKRIPSMFDRPYLVTAGGLMSYGADENEQYRSAADIAVKILKGANPAEVPMEQPTQFHLAVNLKTATALGLTIPRSLLLRADQVIE